MDTNFIKGIDVSHHQDAIEWAKVAAAGIVFAFAKATEGASTKDQMFMTNFTGMKDSSVIRGAYHFYHPSKDAISQTDNFLSVVNSLTPGDLPPVLDIEIDEGEKASEIIAGLKVWIVEVKNALGRTPVIYTNASFWDTKLGGSPDFSDCPLWVAHYTTKPAPNIPTGFNDFIIWQYSQSGVIDGIKGNAVDLDWFKVDINDLKLLAGL